MVLHSQLDISLAFKCIFFLSFCRDKYNWPEEIDVVGDILWLDTGDRGTGMQIQYNYVLEIYFMHIMICTVVESSTA